MARDCVSLQRKPSMNCDMFLKRFVFIWCLLPIATSVMADEAAPALCNPNATEPAQRVFRILNKLYGQKTVSGVVANVNWNTKEAENVYEWTGKWPALNVFDYIHAYAAKDVNPSGWINYKEMTVPRKWWRAGGLVGAMWHWNLKTNDGTGWTCTPGTKDDETSFDVSKIEDSESEEYKQVIKDLDQIAGYLKSMQNAGIPVLWRPLHEAAGNTYEYTGGKAWFWWGSKGAELYKKLWQLMYDRFVNHHQLNNLIWIWTSQVGDETWYPGDEYVDIIGRDTYGATSSNARQQFRTLRNAFPSKMIVLAECGHSSSKKMATVSKMWNAGAQWGWFMTWYDYNYNTGGSTTHQHTDAEWWQDAWDSGIVVDRDEMKQLLNDETGINEAKGEQEEARSGWYTLDGRRLNLPRRGLVISNGKIMMVK